MKNGENCQIVMQTHRVREACWMAGIDRHAPGRVAPNPQFIKISVSAGLSKGHLPVLTRAGGKGRRETGPVGRGSHNGNLFSVGFKCCINLKSIKHDFLKKLAGVHCRNLKVKEDEECPSLL